MANQSNETTIETTGPTFPAELGLCVGNIGWVMNLIVVIILLKLKSRHRSTKLYSLSVATGNMLYSISPVLQFFQPMIRVPQAQTGCSLWIFVDVFGYYSSVGSLLLLAAERVCAIRFPLRFRSMTKPSNVRLQLLVTWLWSVLMTIYPLLEYKVTPGKMNLCAPIHPLRMAIYFFVFDLVLPLTTFMVLTIYAICALKRQWSVSVADSRNGHKSVHPHTKKPCLHLTFVGTMFALCFGPYFINAMVELVEQLSNAKLSENTRSEVVDLLTYLHTWLNPVMHFVCDTSFRSTLTCCFCVSRSDNNRPRKERS